MTRRLHTGSRLSQASGVISYQTPSRGNYYYEPLNAAGHEIRLLDLKPGQQDDPIHCAIRHVSLTQNPEYETMSYVWGDENLRDTIYVDGKTLSVPASSATALGKVREEHNIRTLWIDAVCINQVHTIERNHQVALIRKVFTQGWRNLVYFGEADASTSVRAQHALREVILDCEEETGGPAGLRACLIDTRGQPRRFSLTPIKRRIDFDILMEFAALPWFHRLWVMQEAALAKGSLCYYGSLRITLVDIIRAFIWLYHKRKYIPNALFWSNTVQLAITLHDAYELVDGVCEKIVGHTTSRTVAASLAFGNNLASKDPKDHIFGLLGMMECTRASIPPRLFPDYDKPLITVLQDATSFAIEEEGIKTVFRYIRHRADEEACDPLWVSWVPRWSRALSPSKDCSLLSYAFTADDPTHQTNARSTTIDGKKLRISGFKVDTVHRLGPDFPEPCFANVKALRSTISDIKEMRERFLSGKDNPEESKLRNVRTLLAGMDSDGQPASETTLLELDAFTEYANKHGTLPPFKDIDITAPDEISANASRFATALYNAARNRRFLVTAEGKPALGPSVTKEQDIIVLLDGGPTPYILRPWQNKHKLLGECYVDGIMYGEAIRAHRASSGPEEIFEIC